MATEKLFDLLKEWCGDNLDETVVLGRKERFYSEEGVVIRRLMPPSPILFLPITLLSSVCAWLETTLSFSSD